MTESEAREKPISEVWGEFKSADENYPRTKHIRDRLRAVLLERCSKFTSMRFEVVCEVLVVTHRANQVFWKPQAANDIAAIYAFWAWELKQRNSESNG